MSMGLTAIRVTQFNCNPLYQGLIVTDLLTVSLLHRYISTLTH